MSEIYPERVQATAPGRALYEAVRRAFPEDPWEPWETLTGAGRAGWAAVEQELTAVPSAIIHVKNYLTKEDVAELREQFAEAVHTERPKLLADVKPAPELAAAMAETRQLRALIDVILGEFTDRGGDGFRARIGQVQMARYRELAGLPPAASASQKRRTDAQGAAVAGEGKADINRHPERGASEEASEYCVVHDRPINWCKEPERCREQMRSWGLYPDEAAVSTDPRPASMLQPFTFTEGADEAAVSTEGATS